MKRTAVERYLDLEAQASEDGDEELASDSDEISKIFDIGIPSLLTLSFRQFYCKQRPGGGR